MSDDTTVTSPTPAPAETGDGIKGNMSLDKAAQHLMKLSQQREVPKEAAPEPETSEVAPVETPQDTQPESEQVAEDTPQQSEGDTEEANSQEQADAEPEDVLSQLSTLDPKAQEIAKAALEKQKERLVGKFEKRIDRKSTRLNSSHTDISRMPSSA